MKPKQTTNQQDPKNPLQPARHKNHFVAIEDMPWERRHWDPFVKMIWNSMIKVEPANSEKRIYKGFRTYPDGYREEFTVFGRD